MLRFRQRPGLLTRYYNTTYIVPFAYETEAQTFFTAAAAAGADPSTTRKRTYNTLIKYLKRTGVWAKLTHLYLLTAHAQAASLINVRNPGTNDCTIVGAPTFTANDGWVATASGTGKYLNTGIPLNSIQQNNFSCGLYSFTATPISQSDFGALDASNNGLAINTQTASTNQFVSRSMSAAIFHGTSSDTDGSGFFAISRNSASTTYANRNGYRFSTSSTASATVTDTRPIWILQSNSTSSQAAGRKLGLVFFGTYLTEAEIRCVHAAYQTYLEAITYGEYYEESAGVGTANITADVIVYGTTSGAVTAAYQAARSGKTVAIIGGWRDRRLGGMSTGGLNNTDFDNHASLGGLPRWVLTKINSLYGRADTNFTFESRYFQRALRFLMDSTKNGGYSLPVYYSNGVLSVTKSGTNITSIRTVDGRTVTGSVFIDCSYEGDLAKMAGVSMTKGREAAGSGKEALNGFRGVLTSDAGDNHQFKSAGSPVAIDPYVIPGNAGSGLMNGISRTYGVGTPANGAADDQIQAYNFRMTLVRSDLQPRRFVAFPNTPPAGYNAADWEPLGRLMAAYPSTTLADLFIIGSIGATNDFNSRGGWSTDYWGASTAYPAASYAAREVIWKAHWNRILGLFYYLQYDPDSRVTSTVRNAALLYGFDCWNYLDGIHENDAPFVNPQLYVREAWRMTSDFIMTGNDIVTTDGTTPRSTKTIATASYAMDSHSTEALADPNGGTPRIWASGNFESYGGGTDQTTPVPYDIIIPKASEVTNLFVTFAVSATHVAFGSVRMEFTFMQLSQSAGLAAVHAINNGVTVQNVDYSALRTALLASATLSGEVAPVLPQVN